MPANYTDEMKQGVKGFLIPPETIIPGFVSGEKQ
jgi:hypothetical protein